MAIDPVTGLAIASTAINLGGGLFSMFKKDPKIEDQSGMMLSNLASMENIAADLRSRQGLPDTVIGRMEKQVAQGASQIAAESMQLGRQSILANPILVDRLAQQALEKSAQFIESGVEKIQGIDVQAVESNLDKALGARSAAFQGAAKIADYQKSIEAMNNEIEKAKMANMANMFGNAASSMVQLAGTGDGKAVPQTQTTDISAGAQIAKPIEAAPDISGAGGNAAPAVPRGEMGMFDSRGLFEAGFELGTTDLDTKYLDEIFNFNIV